MKFAILGHLIDENTIKQLPQEWVNDNIILSPEMEINRTVGTIAAIKYTAKQIMTEPQQEIRKSILDAAVYLQDKLGVDIIQLGALNTSITSGGEWLAEQEEYKGFVNHGDSYTAAVTCKAVKKSLERFNLDSSEKTLAIVGAYGVIGEAVSKILVPEFSHSILIGRREEKLKELENQISGSFETTTEMKTKDADIVVTATNHPTALLNSSNLKKDAIVVDVSQPVNLSLEVCQERPDIRRIDGGYVDFPVILPIPGMPPYKSFACIAEAIMQAMENEKENHVGSIDLKHLKKTEEWAKKYGFSLNELTNFGKPF